MIGELEIIGWSIINELLIYQRIIDLSDLFIKMAVWEIDEKEIDFDFTNSRRYILQNSEWE